MGTKVRSHLSSFKQVRRGSTSLFPCRSNRLRVRPRRGCSGSPGFRPAGAFQGDSPARSGPESSRPGFGAERAGAFFSPSGRWSENIFLEKYFRAEFDCGWKATRFSISSDSNHAKAGHSREPRINDVRGRRRNPGREWMPPCHSTGQAGLSGPACREQRRHPGSYDGNEVRVSDSAMR
jgi:hypothetical protein